METHCVIRLAAVDDIPELRRLNELFNGVQEAPEQLARRLEDLRGVETALVAELDGRLVGFASLRLAACAFSPEPRAELTELFVEAEYRRGGIGGALVAFAEPLAAAGGASELFILTGIDNREAQALYRSLGYSDDNLAMCKKLK